jgi:hypothetical protein
MNRVEWEFAVGNRPKIVVAVSSADLVIAEGDPGTVKVAMEGQERDLDLFDVVQTGDVVSVRNARGGRRLTRRGVMIRMEVPAGAVFDGQTASGDLRIAVAVSDVEIRVASGDVDLASCNGRVRIKSASGDISIGDLGGSGRISSASGDIRIDRIEGEVLISTASGDVALGSVRGSVEANAASGDVTIRRFSGVSLEGGSMSGDFDIGLVSGMSIEADVRTRSGRFRNLVQQSDGEPSIAATMRIRTMSGDVTLR